MSSDNGRMRLPKLRISTVMFLLLVAAGLLLVSIPGQIVEEPILNLCGQSEPTYGLEKMCHHGWPFAFLVRVATKTPTSPFGRLSLPASPSLRLSLWNLPEGIVRWSAWRLVADILVALLLLLAAGTMFERWRRRRGRFQLCLIDIFVISTAVACGFAYWATQAAERNRQAETVKQLKLSGMLGVAENKDLVTWLRGGPSWLREWFGDRPFAGCDRVIDVYVAGEALARLSQLPNLKVVHVGLSGLSNRQIDLLRELPQLEALHMHFAAICHEEKGNGPVCKLVVDKNAYIRLPPLPRLRALSLFAAHFRGEGLEGLAGIEVLDLGRTNVGDDAMPKFEAMQNLKSLSLARTDITDAGLEHLKGLSQLRELWVRSDKVTTEGIQRLQRALPNCKIE